MIDVPDVKPCPICMSNQRFELESEDDADRHLISSSDTAFLGPGKDRSVTDAYCFEVPGSPKFMVHVFPLCPSCCGTGVVIQDEDFAQIQAEVAMATDNLEQVIKYYSADPSTLREHTDRLTRFMIPLIARKALHLVHTPARGSYARYLTNLFNIRL
ncbi:MAG: hypothetical protein CVU65_11435 [Deltaproteobacteria bacterium HGW-Deltaproteobacteria-22]|nr:MAG: hypothetical protein CVU65_11435 [Deltaproteobacteria bacterium HGW-Deltaproteobacteria-22]